MINITEQAKQKMLSILDDEGATMVRFGLQGGGCNGFQYFITLEEKQEEDDFTFPLDDERILLVDAMSNTYLQEAEIDYKKDMMGETFVFKNPNVKHSCGCGSSVGF
jgi:iron-sulfur cluster assembly protein